MSSLYTISNEILSIFSAIENQGGEITDEQYTSLIIKQDELDAKLDSYVKAIKEFEKDADFCKAEKKAINDRQNVYKNRVERLKNAVLNAVIAFGQQGKNNMFIELPNCRLYTRNSKSIKINEERISIFLSEFERYVRELVSNDILCTDENIDLEGLLECINANIKAEYGEDFEPFTLIDLYAMQVNVTTTMSVFDLFRKGGNALIQYANNPIDTKISSVTSKDDLKTIIDNAEKSNTDAPTIATVITNQSLQIK